MQITDIRDAIKAAIGAGGQDVKTPDPNKPTPAPNRFRIRRAGHRSRHYIGRDFTGWPRSSQGRQPRPTGTPHHVKQWRSERLQRMQLMAIRTEKLEAVLGAPALVLADAYPNVWSLANAKVHDLLALPTIGPATLRKVRTHLLAQQPPVPVRWEVKG